MIPIFIEPLMWSIAFGVLVSSICCYSDYKDGEWERYMIKVYDEHFQRMRKQAHEDIKRLYP